MSDYSELKRLAESAPEGPWSGPEYAPGTSFVFDVDLGTLLHYESIDTEQDACLRYVAAANPAAVLGLIAENERLERAVKRRNDNLTMLRGDVESKDQRIRNYFETIDALADERDQLKADNEFARMRIKELDLLFGRYILAMRSALIEEEHGKGPAAAMEWIYNSLAGPGELPPEGETDSQAYFDREIVAVDDGMQQVIAFHDGRRAAMSKGEQQ